MVRLAIVAQVDEGEPIRQVLVALRSALADGHLQAYVDRLCVAFGAAAQLVTDPCAGVVAVSGQPAKTNAQNLMRCLL